VTVDAGAGTPEALAILQRHGADLGPSGRAISHGEDESTRQERRRRQDVSYTGPERRLVGV
jgi:hypothetical protein